MNSSFETAQPNGSYCEALDLIPYSRAENQNVPFYEWCEGAFWHRKNLHLLFRHYAVRFYN